MQPKDYSQLLFKTLENKPVKLQSEILGRFKNILIRNNESYLAPAIAREFVKIQKQSERARTTYISSSSKLSNIQHRELESAFPEPLEFSVNQNLLGGIAVRNKDMVYNSTLRKKIESLKRNL